MSKNKGKDSAIITANNRFELFDDEQNDDDGFVKVVSAKNKAVKKKPIPVTPVTVVETKQPEVREEWEIDVQEEQPKPTVNTGTGTWSDKIKETKPTVVVDEVKKVMEDGSKLKLNSEWDLWVHDIDSNDWTINDYKKIFTIKTVSDFWKLFNNITKLNHKYYHFFLMRNGILPIWEDVNNRNGGICSLKSDMNKGIDIFTVLGAHAVGETMLQDMNDLNGISFSPKNNWVILKVWNRCGKNDVSKTLMNNVLKKYHDLSVKYKENVPEY